MPRWVPKTLRRIRELAAARKVLFTLKALRELASLELGLDEEDACDVLSHLAAEDSAGRFESAATGEWMYLFQATALGDGPVHQGASSERLRRRFVPRGRGW